MGKKPVDLGRAPEGRIFPFDWLQEALPFSYEECVAVPEEAWDRLRQSAELLERSAAQLRAALAAAEAREAARRLEVPEAAMQQGTPTTPGLGSRSRFTLREQAPSSPKILPSLSDVSLSAAHGGA